jgi:peptide/nickel transport system substrate-binding protein
MHGHQKSLSLALLVAAATLLGSAAGNAEDKCVRVIGNESSGEKVSMDPAFQPSTDDAYHLFAVYNRFLDVDDEFNPVPELAKSWSVSEDGLTWTFKLQEGVKFHDGSDFDSGDVVYTFRRLMDPAVGSPAKPLLSFLTPESFEAVDPLTVRVKTKTPVSELPLLLTFKFNLIVPEGATSEQLKTKENGTGPFIQESFTIGEPARVLRKNTHYWKPGLPKADCIRINIVTEAVPALAAIKSGQADLVMSLPPEVVPSAKGDPSVKLLETGAGTSSTLSMEIDKAPFDNPKVREALKAVVDRQAMVDTVMLGFGEPGNDNPVPPSWPSAFTHEVPKRDVARAKQLLSEAGYPDGIDIELNTGEGAAGYVQMAEVYKEMAAEAGIRVNIIKNPGDGYWDNVWMKKPFFSSGWSIRPPAEGLTIAYTKEAEWNETNWKRDDYDSILQAAKAEIDPDKRNALYKQAQQMLTEQGGVIIPIFQHQIVAIRSNCEGYKPHAQNFNLNYETIVCK